MIVMNWKTGCTGNEETRKRKIVIVGTFVVVLCCVCMEVTIDGFIFFVFVTRNFGTSFCFLFFILFYFRGLEFRT